MKFPSASATRLTARITDEIPADVQGLEQIKPIYTKLKGWRTSTEGIADIRQAAEGRTGLLAFPGEGKRREDRHGLHRA